MKAERTNGETLIWVQSLKGYGQASLNSAKSFLHFDGDHRQLKLWKERLLMEHKKIKQDIQTRLHQRKLLVICNYDFKCYGNLFVGSHCTSWNRWRTLCFKLPRETCRQVTMNKCEKLPVTKCRWLFLNISEIFLLKLFSQVGT